jgi:hypothetical protein
MLYSLQIDMSRKTALLKMLLKHQYLHVVIALYVELPFILCLCTDTARYQDVFEEARLGGGPSAGW